LTGTREGLESTIGWRVRAGFLLRETDIGCQVQPVLRLAPGVQIARLGTRARKEREA